MLPLAKTSWFGSGQIHFSCSTINHFFCSWKTPFFYSLSDCKCPTVFHTGSQELLCFERLFCCYFINFFTWRNCVIYISKNKRRSNAKTSLHRLSYSPRQSQRSKAAKSYTYSGHATYSQGTGTCSPEQSNSITVVASHSTCQNHISPPGMFLSLLLKGNVWFFINILYFLTVLLCGTHKSLL